MSYNPHDLPAFEPKLLVFTAPSGAGKTTIVRHLLNLYPFLGFSISATNREKRPNEIDGKDYYFLTTDAFKEKVQENAFIEWEEVYDNQYYGTLKSEVERIWSEKKYVVFDIEVKGATNIKKLYGDKALVVFIRPPSLEILIQRLIDRNTESPASLRKRINRVKKEMQYENSFDYVLVNDVLDVSLKEAEIITESFILGKLSS